MLRWDMIYISWALKNDLFLIIYVICVTHLAYPLTLDLILRLPKVHHILLYIYTLRLQGILN